jgi:choice-of-anchor A domain-containing protein
LNHNCYIYFSAQSACTCTPLPGIGTITSYNAIIFGNFGTSSDVEGTLIICGSYTTANSASIGIALGASYPGANATLELNGSIVAGNNALHISQGSVVASSTPTRSVSTSACSSGASYCLDGRTIDLQSSSSLKTVRIDSTIPTKCQTIASNVQQLSSVLAGMPTTPGNSILIPSAQNSALKFLANSIDCNGNSVFNSTVAETFGNTNTPQSVEIDVASGLNVQLIIINLFGKNVPVNINSNFIGTWFNSAKSSTNTIWNFPDTQQFSLTVQFMGALIAPNAVVSKMSNQINGLAIFQSINAEGEFHSHPAQIPSCI